MGDSDRRAVVDALRAILEPFAPPLVASTDPAGGLMLEAPEGGRLPAKMFVAAVREGRSYVSFHLMPVYVYPELLDGMSPELRRRMQGKSCFNFTRVDERLFEELSSLTARGIERLRESGVPPKGPTRRR